MPGYSPQTVYPFAVKGLLVISQMWVIVYGWKYSYTLRIVSTFMITAIVMLLVPLLAHMQNGAGFWSVFFMLFFFGIVSGICQASIFSIVGGLP